MNVIGTILATFNLTHPYFAKDYVKPKPIVPELDNELVPNVGEFFDLLPTPKPKGKRQKHCTLVGLTKHERTEKALKKLRLRKE